MPHTAMVQDFVQKLDNFYDLVDEIKASKGDDTDDLTSSGQGDHEALTSARLADHDALTSPGQADHDALTSSHAAEATQRHGDEMLVQSAMNADMQLLATTPLANEVVEVTSERHTLDNDVISMETVVLKKPRDTGAGHFNC